MGRSTDYYRTHPKARRKKVKTDKKLNSKPAQIKKRVEANRARRKAKARGKNVTGLDYDHAVKRFVKSSVNKGRKGEGGRKKGSKRKKK